MPIYQDEEQLLNIMKSLFEHMRYQTPNPVDTLIGNRTILRIQTSNPNTSILIDARNSPVRILYDNSINLKPELDIQITGVVLHQILMGQLSITKALGTGQLKFLGPVWKTFPLAKIFEQGQLLYPELYQQHQKSLD